MRVLVIDNDPDSREMLAQSVRKRGHEVESYPDGAPVWQAFQEGLHALVIVDWSGGDALCRKIRHHSGGTVIVAVAEEADALESVLSAGADDFLTKPIDPTIFDIRIAIAEQRVLDVTRRADAQEEMKRLNNGLTRANEKLQAANEKLKSNQAQLVHSEKMASLGQLAAGIAHEINNPVGFVKSNLGMLSDYVGIFKDLLSDYGSLAESIRDEPLNGQAEILEHIEKISKEENLEFLLTDVDSLLAESLTGTERVREIAQSLKSFARLDEAEMQFADVNEGMRATLRMIWSELKYHCTVHEDLRPLPPILCFPGQLNQVFMNLLVNASQAMKDEGEITIETWAEDDQVVIRISDSGEGIPQENIPKLFNPFFTTKPVGKGTGLGLSVSYGIIKKHNGRIEVESELGKGTTFSIYLPITDEGP
jgi:signal transduction histidine kinase